MRIAAVVLLAVVVAAAPARADRVVAIAPLSTLGAEDTSAATKQLGDQLATAAAALGGTKVVTTEQVVAAIKKANQPQLKTCERDPACLANLGKLRREVLATHPRSEERKLLLHELAQRQICDSPTCSTRQLAQTPTHQEKTVILSDRSAAEGVEGPAVAFPSAQVALVGAGPGDPELLTLRALRLIQSAQVIIHDDLVPEAILSLASPSAETINVGKRCGTKYITQDEINALMIDHAESGRTVVRLKSGDPLLFGRAAEEIAALTEAGVSYTIVPGVSAAFAAAAALGRSLTDRACASSVLLTTGHHAQSHNNAPLPQIEDATRVVYMPGRDLTLLAAQWLAEGLPPDFPCAVVSHAAQPDQQVLHTTLAALGQATPTAAPSLLIAGWAVRELDVNELLASGVLSAAAD